MKFFYIFILISNINCSISEKPSSSHKNTSTVEVINSDFRNAISAFNSKHNISINKNLGSVYVITNETGLDEVRNVLKSTALINNSCHIGTAGWYNFDLISLRKSEYGIIFDYNPNNANFIETSMKLVMQAKNPNEFVKLIISFLESESNTIKIDDNKNINLRIKKELTREGSWLSSEQNFNFIKQRIKEGKIASFTNTITDTLIIEKLKTFLDRKGIIVDTIYLSNIRVFIDPKDKENFKQSIEILSQPETLIINCPALLNLKDKNWRVWNLHQVIKNLAYLKSNPDNYFEISD